MSTTGSVFGGTPSQSWIDSLRNGSIENVLNTEGEVGATSELKHSEKQRIEELSIAGLPFLPPPTLSFQVFQEIATEFNKCFGIERAHGSSALSSAESATLAGVFGEYAKVADANLVTALVGAAVGANPMEKILTNYMENGQLVPMTSLNPQLFSHRFPTLSTALRTADPDLLEKAFCLAQQQIVLSMLQKWSESTAQIAEQAREYRKTIDLQMQEIQRNVFQEYIKETWEKQPSVTQPAFSVLLGTVALDASLITTFTAAISGLSLTTQPLIHASVAAEFTILAAGILTSTVSWATPVAISLARGVPHESEEQFSRDAAKAFAITLVGILSSENLNTFLLSRLEHAVNTNLLQKTQVDSFLATFKASLLISSMALLYHSQYGGVTGGELKGIMEGQMSLSQDDFLITLAKLVKEQLEKINPSDRAAILSTIFQSYDNTPSLAPLLDPIKIFMALWDPRFFRAANVARPA